MKISMPLTSSFDTISTFDEAQRQKARLLLEKLFCLQHECLKFLDLLWFHLIYAHFYK